MGDDLGRETVALVADGMVHAAGLTSQALTKSYRDITHPTAHPEGAWELRPEISLPNAFSGPILHSTQGLSRHLIPQAQD
jgi:hypothetical protein